MQYFAVMDMLDSETNLCEPIQDLVLIKELLSFFFLGDSLGQVTALSKLHNDFEFVLFGDIDFDEFNDIGMIEVS